MPHSCSSAPTHTQANTHICKLAPSCIQMNELSRRGNDMESSIQECFESLHPLYLPEFSRHIAVYENFFGVHVEHTVLSTQQHMKLVWY